MYCSNCGKQIPNDSVFCPSCGTKVAESPKDIEPQNDEIDSLVSDKDPIDFKHLENKPIKDIFITIHDAQDDVEKYFNSYTSPAMWELLKRLGNNSFESFITENKEYLNPLPYDVLETLKTTFSYIVHWGYWTNLSNKFKLNKAKKPTGVDIETLVNEWQQLLGTATKNFDKNLTEEENSLMNVMLDLSFNSISDKAPELKKSPYILIENIKNQLALLLIWGYIAGIAEEKYKK